LRNQAKISPSASTALSRNLDTQAKQKVQAVLRGCGRDPDIKLTLLSDGEDGLRGVIGGLGRNALIDWTVSCVESLRENCTRAIVLAAS